MTTADEAALATGLALTLGLLGAYAWHLARLRARLPRTGDAPGPAGGRVPPPRDR